MDEECRVQIVEKFFDSIIDDYEECGVRINTFVGKELFSILDLR